MEVYVSCTRTELYNKLLKIVDCEPVLLDSSGLLVRRRRLLRPRGVRSGAHGRLDEVAGGGRGAADDVVSCVIVYLSAELAFVYFILLY